MKYSLDIGALIADLLLCHLESSWSQRPSDHFLPAVAPPFARSRFGHRPVVSQLNEVPHVKLLQGDPKVHHNVRALGSLALATVATAVSEKVPKGVKATEEITEGTALTQRCTHYFEVSN